MTKRQADSILSKLSLNLKNYGISKVSFGSEFLFNPDNNSITIPLTLDYRDKWFKEFLKERFEFDTDDIYCMLMLHEIGHYFTYNDISESLNDYCNQDKVRIALEIQMNCNTREETKPYNWQYWYLPDEFTATMWAVEYSKQCPKEVKNLFKRINKLVKPYITIEE